MAARGEKIAETKVDYLDVSILTNEDVLDLEISMNNTVPMTVVEGAGDLTAELASLLLLQLAVGDDVVKHLTTVDVFAEHIPVIVGAHNVSHAADVGVIEKSHYGGLSGGPDLLGLVCSLLICSGLVPILRGTTRDDFASNLWLKGIRMSIRYIDWVAQSRKERERKRQTCSPVSSLRASFTLPILPAPIVLPSIHFPDGVGMVVRDLLVCFEAEDAPGLLGSGAP